MSCGIYAESASYLVDAGYARDYAEIGDRNGSDRHEAFSYIHPVGHHADQPGNG